MGLMFKDDLPSGHKYHGKTLALPGFAKADGLKFPPWEIVNGGSRRVEEQIAARCKAANLPVVVFDWNNEELVEQYFSHNPEKMPAGTAAVAKMIARTTAPEDAGKVAAPLLSMESIPAMTVSHEAGSKRRRSAVEE